jgi:hypothetical protein
MFVSSRSSTVRHATSKQGQSADLPDDLYSHETYIQDSLMLLEVYQRIMQGDYSHLHGAISQADVREAQTVQRTLNSQRRREIQIYTRIALTRPSPPTSNLQRFAVFLDRWRDGPVEISNADEESGWEGEGELFRNPQENRERLTTEESTDYTRNSQQYEATSKRKGNRHHQRELAPPIMDRASNYREAGPQSKKPRLEGNFPDPNDFGWSDDSDLDMSPDKASQHSSRARSVDVVETALVPSSSKTSISNQAENRDDLDSQETSKRATHRKAITEKFRKRKISLVNKAGELADFCKADVYLLIRRNERFYIYSSTNQSSWPPSPEQIVCSHHL